MFVNIFVPGHLARRIVSTLSLYTCITSGFILALVASAPQVKPSLTMIVATAFLGLVSGGYLFVLRLISDNFFGNIATKSAANAESQSEARKVA